MKEKKQKGGSTGTEGNLSTFVDDIGALVTSTIDTIINTTELIVDVVELPVDIGKAYETPKGQNLSA